jgi:hypothetical protein
MLRGQKWRCANPECGAEMVVTESSQEPRAGQPTCGCGSKMKRTYEKPIARKVALASRSD